MSDDLLLKELAQVIRDREAEERSRLDERWDRLSAGTLSPEEEAELRALAETSEEARAAYEAFRPLGAEFQARVVQKIQKQQGLASVTRFEVKKLQEEPPPFWRSTLRWAGWSTAAAAAAAVLILLLRPVPLPVYASLEVHGDQTWRGEEPSPPEVPVLAPGARFQGMLQIATASRAKDLEDQYFLIRGQDVRRLEVDSDIDPGGAIKMKGSIGRDLPSGTWILWAVVGRRGKLPDPADLRRFSAQAQVPQKDWVAIPKEIKIQNRDLPP